MAVSLPPELLAAAKSAVASGRAESVSAYVADALRAKAMHDDLLGLLDEMLAESGGPLTPDEVRWADTVLGR